MIDYVVNALRRAMDTSYSKSYSKAAVALIDHVEEEEYANRLLLNLRGINSRVDLIEQEKIKYETLTLQLISTWNSRRGTDKVPLQFLISTIEIRPYPDRYPGLPIHSPMHAHEQTDVYSAKFILTAEDHIVYSQWVVLNNDLKTGTYHTTELLYRMVYDDLTTMGIRYYVNRCSYFVELARVASEAKAEAERLRILKQEEDKRIKEIERKIKASDSERRLLADRREVEYLAQRRLQYAINKYECGNSQIPIVDKERPVAHSIILPNGNPNAEARRRITSDKRTKAVLKEWYDQQEAIAEKALRDARKNQMVNVAVSGIQIRNPMKLAMHRFDDLELDAMGSSSHLNTDRDKPKRVIKRYRDADDFDYDLEF